MSDINYLMTSGNVHLPEGRIELDRALELKPGMNVSGYGTFKNSPGTTLVPSPGYMGPLIHWPAGGILHHCSVSNLRTEGSQSDGIQIEGDVGELFTLDRIMSVNNQGNGIYFMGQTIPCVLGYLDVHNNVGDGVCFKSPTILQIQFISGDNNRTLFHVENGDWTTSINVIGFKSERWGGTPSQADIFLVENMNGGVFKLGPGSVHVGGGSQDGNAVIRVRGGKATYLYIDPITIFSGNGSDGYRYGVQNEITGNNCLINDFKRRRYTAGLPEILAKAYL